jgi:hypothetical protein
MRSQLVDDLTERARASAAEVAVKICRIAPDSSGCWVRLTWPSMSPRK